MRSGPGGATTSSHHYAACRNALARPDRPGGGTGCRGPAAGGPAALGSFGPPRNRYMGSIDEVSLQQLSMLRILHATCTTALDAFRAADNPVDAQLVIDLEKMVERTGAELERFANSS